MDVDAEASRAKEKIELLKSRTPLTEGEGPPGSREGHRHLPRKPLPAIGASCPEVNVHWMPSGRAIRYLELPVPIDLVHLRSSSSLDLLARGRRRRDGCGFYL